jgi:hypothetical protein
MTWQSSVRIADVVGAGIAIVDGYADALEDTTITLGRSSRADAARTGAGYWRGAHLILTRLLPCLAVHDIEQTIIVRIHAFYSDWPDKLV